MLGINRYIVLYLTSEDAPKHNSREREVRVVALLAVGTQKSENTTVRFPLSTLA